ncbi:MAG: SCO family protein [Bdellovibrionota bacterium]
MFGLVLAGLLALEAPLARGAEQAPPELAGVGIDPVLGTQAPLNEMLLNETGKAVPLSTFFDGKRPVVLVLSYYGCPMLCGLVLNSTRNSLEKLDWTPGDHYRIVTISIDPAEKPALAAEKKSSIVGASTNAAFKAGAEANWHFLVGVKGSEKRVADAMGFHYKWNEEEKQWAHGAAIFLLSPSGKLTRVLFGVDFPSQDLKLALLEAGNGKVGTIAEKLLLFCYHYDPKGNKYAILASRLVSMGGAFTVIVLLFAWFVWFVRVRKSAPTGEAAG